MRQTVWRDLVVPNHSFQLVFGRDVRIQIISYPITVPPLKINECRPWKGTNTTKGKKKKELAETVIFQGDIRWFSRVYRFFLDIFCIHHRRGPKESRVEIREVETIFYQQKREGKKWTLASGFRKRWKWMIGYDKWIWYTLLEMIRNVSFLS